NNQTPTWRIDQDEPKAVASMMEQNLDEPNMLAIKTLGVHSSVT
ncbi:hypothetical protein EJB05_07785, partial [Eragrostis curvula]